MPKPHKSRINQGNVEHSLWRERQTKNEKQLTEAKDNVANIAATLAMYCMVGSMHMNKKQALFYLALIYGGSGVAGLMNFINATTNTQTNIGNAGYSNAANNTTTRSNVGHFNGTNTEQGICFKDDFHSVSQSSVTVNSNVTTKFEQPRLPASTALAPNNNFTASAKVVAPSGNSTTAKMSSEKQELTPKVSEKVRIPNNNSTETSTSAEASTSTKRPSSAKTLGSNPHTMFAQKNRQSTSQPKQLTLSELRELAWSKMKFKTVPGVDDTNNALSDQQRTKHKNLIIDKIISTIKKYPETREVFEKVLRDKDVKILCLSQKAFSTAARLNTLGGKFVPEAKTIIFPGDSPALNEVMILHEFEHAHVFCVRDENPKCQTSDPSEQTLPISPPITGQKVDELGRRFRLGYERIREFTNLRTKVRLLGEKNLSSDERGKYTKYAEAAKGCMPSRELVVVSNTVHDSFAKKLAANPQSSHFTSVKGRDGLEEKMKVVGVMADNREKCLIVEPVDVAYTVTEIPHELETQKDAYGNLSPKEALNEQYAKLAPLSKQARKEFFPEVEDYAGKYFKTCSPDQNGEKPLSAPVLQHR